jgi:hypothetical protein
VELHLTGKDGAGQATMGLVDAYVDSSTHLSLHVQVPGYLVDVSGTRSLYDEGDGLTIADSADGSSVSIPGGAVPYPFVGYGFLDPQGAIYMTWAGNDSIFDLHDWHDGALVDLGLRSELSVQGRWAAFGGEPSYALILRDLSTGMNTPIAGSDVGSSDVAADGSVAFQAGPDGIIDIWRNGLSTRLPGQTGSNRGPSTDGTLVVYVHNSSGGTFDSLVLNDGTGETVLVPPTPVNDFAFRPGWGYRVSNGWVAYLKPDSMQVSQVWRHGPAGDEQLTFFSSSSSIAALGSDGTVIVSSRVWDGRLYSAVPGQQLRDIAAGFGPVVYRDGGFVEIIGGYALDLAP